MFIILKEPNTKSIAANCVCRCVYNISYRFYIHQVLVFFLPLLVSIFSLRLLHKLRNIDEQYELFCIIFLRKFLSHELVVRTHEERPATEKRKNGGQEWEIAFTTKMIDESVIHWNEKAASLLFRLLLSAHPKLSGKNGIPKSTTTENIIIFAVYTFSCFALTQQQRLN